MKITRDTFGNRNVGTVTIKCSDEEFILMREMMRRDLEENPQLNNWSGRADLMLAMDCA